MTADREVLRAAPTAAVNSCRWCGIEPREHARRWSSSVGWHTWESPQDSLRHTTSQVRSKPRGARR